MGRKKSISESDLIRLLEQFISEECLNTPERCTFANFSFYLKNKGYPVEAHVLRRNLQVKERFADIKNHSRSADYVKLVSYKTLDAKAFVETNRGDKAMILALTQLDSKYKHICDVAVKYIQEGASQIRKIETLEREITIKDIEIKNKNSKLEEMEREREEYRRCADTYKRFIDTYVYPEAANELLGKMGLLQDTPDIVSKDVVTDSLFKGSDKLPQVNNVIAGLFDRFEE